MESIQVIFYLYGAYVINFEEFKSIETQKEFKSQIALYVNDDKATKVTLKLNNSGGN